MSLPPGTVLAFREHPEKPGWWVFKERWPFGKVWEIPGSADMSVAEQYFPDWHTGLGWDGVPGSVVVGGAFGWRLFVWWARRRWLDFHGARVPRSVWRRARPLPWVRPG